jgi:hypothetical protein
MTASTVFLVLLVLACPLMMLFMMRGHGRGGDQDGHESAAAPGDVSTEELRRRRDELDRQIAERAAGEDTPTHVGGGWR